MIEVALAVVIKDDKVLVIKRAEQDGGFWAFPGGEIIAPTSAEQTAVGEVLEETGVVCEVVKKIGQRLHPTTKKEIIYFLCNYVAGEAKVVVPEEVERVVWLTKPAAIQTLGPSLFEPVKNILEQ